MPSHFTVTKLFVRNGKVRLWSNAPYADHGCKIHTFDMTWSFLTFFVVDFIMVYSGFQVSLRFESIEDADLKIVVAVSGFLFPKVSRITNGSR